MATIVGVTTTPFSFNNVEHTIWETLTETDTDGDAYTNPQAADVSVEAIGTFGGATISLEGSNVLSPGASDWVAVHDVAGTAIAFTEAGCALVAENMLHLRPSVSGGSGTDVDVHLIARRTD